MKRILTTTLILGVTAFASLAVKIGIVDMNAIVIAMPETVTVEQQIKETQQKYQEQLEIISKEFQRQYTEIQNMAPDTPSAVRDIKMAALQETQKKGEAFQNRIMEDLVAQRDSLMAPIFTRIQDEIQNLSRENELDLVMEKGKQPNQVYYFSEKIVNLTPLLITRLTPQEQPN